MQFWKCSTRQGSDPVGFGPRESREQSFAYAGSWPSYAARDTCPTAHCIQLADVQQATSRVSKQPMHPVDRGATNVP
jgi:hypothetical protein